MQRSSFSSRGDGLAGYEDMHREVSLNSSGHAHRHMLPGTHTTSEKERGKENIWNRKERVGRWHFTSSYGYVALQKVPVVDQARFERVDRSLRGRVNGFLRGMMQICADTQTETRELVSVCK